jgi:hypothetical protein
MQPPKRFFIYHYYPEIGTAAGMVREMSFKCLVRSFADSVFFSALMFQLLSKFVMLEKKEPTYAETMSYDGQDGNRFEKPADCSTGSSHYCSGREEG